MGSSDDLPYKAHTQPFTGCGIVSDNVGMSWVPVCMSSLTVETWRTGCQKAEVARGDLNRTWDEDGMSMRRRHVFRTRRTCLLDVLSARQVGACTRGS